MSSMVAQKRTNSYIADVNRVLPAAAALILGACVEVYAQYGAILHAAVGETELTVGSAIRLVGTAAGTLRPEVGAEEARSSLQKLGFRLPQAPDSSPISYDGFAFLVTQIFDLRGSVAYGLFPGPLSAFDELQSRGLIPRGAHGGGPVSGQDALLLVRRLVEQKGPR
jgi:hypothetical protein